MKNTARVKRSHLDLLLWSGYCSVQRWHCISTVCRSYIFFYGVIGGIGLGTGYITPVSTLVKWFPNNRGFATGLAIMGFGFASLIAGPLMQILVAKYGLVQNFIILGCVYMVIMAASALYLEPPKASNGGPSGINVKSILPDTQFTAKEARKTWQFYALWWIFFHQYYLRYRTFSRNHYFFRRFQFLWQRL